jgi:hypothetical protein
LCEGTVQMTKGLDYGRGTECNPVKIGGVTELFGDPARKPEKPYTILLFPGGSVEVSRCENGSYWVHVATDQAMPSDPRAQITEARVDAVDRECGLTNHALKKEIAKGGVCHVAFLVGPRPF